MSRNNSVVEDGVHVDESAYFYSGYLDRTPTPLPDIDEQKASQCFLVKVGLFSDRGPRSKNDDSAVYSMTTDAFAVADGIGGAPYGDAASRSACVAAVKACERGCSVREAFKYGNIAAIDATTKLLASADSGTTLVVLEIVEESLLAAYVGDTAVFLVRNGVIERLTEEGRQGDSNALESAAGYDEYIEPRVIDIPIQTDDVIVCCTDGVWTALPEDVIARLSDPLKGAVLIAEDIVQAALLTTGDNATALVLLIARADDQESR